MADIFLLLKILLFGSSITLNSTPIDLGSDTTNIPLIKNLEVLTPGAHVRIDVSSEIFSGGTIDRLNEITENFPQGCVVAVLESQNGVRFVFDKSGGSVGGETSEIMLLSSVPLSEELEFVSFSVSSCKVIRNASIKWKNHTL